MRQGGGEDEEVGRLIGELSAELGRGPTEGEVVERLGWTVERVWEVRGTVSCAASLSKPGSGEDGSSRLEDLVVDETPCDVPDAVIEEMKAGWLREAVERLPQKVRYAPMMRYGLGDRDVPTLAELAAELNPSRERVNQPEREAEFLAKSGTSRPTRRSVAWGCLPQSLWHKGVSQRNRALMGKGG